jgi:transposase
VVKVTARTYTVDEVAEAWEVSRRTIYRWAAEGRLLEGADFERTPGQSPSGRAAYRFWASALPASARRRVKA